MDVPRLVASVNRILAGNLTIQGQGGGREAPLKPIRWVPEGGATSKSPYNRRLKPWILVGIPPVLRSKWRSHVYPGFSLFAVDVSYVADKSLTNILPRLGL